MKKTIIKTAAAVGLCVTMLAATIPASAAYVGRDGQQTNPPAAMGQQAGGLGGQSENRGWGGDMGFGGGFNGNQAQGPGAVQNGQIGMMPGGVQIGGQAPENVPGEAPSGSFGEVPGGSFGEAPSGSFGEAPSGSFGEVPSGSFGEVPGGSFGEAPSGSFGEAPSGSFGEVPGGSFGEAPSGSFGEVPGGSFGEAPSGSFGEAPSGSFGEAQGNPFEQTQAGTAAQSSTDSPTAIVEGITTNSAAALVADYENATTYDVGETGSVTIKSAGTYIITGTNSDASITVKKGTTGVVLILQDLNLTSSSGAALAVNKTAEAKIIISGSVTLTDAEDPADEYSTDEDVTDAYDGAAIKVKAGATAYITGTGTLAINGNAKNGIKAGDETALVIDGPTVNITAANDGINGNYDVAILSGSVTVSAGDDGIHADRILTVGADVTISKSYEGIEATVVNIIGGTINVTASDDGVNAANSDGTYTGEMAYSINMTGGSLTVNTSADGLDSNGNINLISGSATIHSVYNGGDAGIDYDGALYISEDFDLNNYSGVAGPDNMMGGQMGGSFGGMNGQMGGQPMGR